jgi:hypothetical protein
MGKGKRNRQLHLEDAVGAPQKRQTKKQFVMPKWAKIAICAVLLLAIVGGIVAASIINSGVIYRNRVFIESKSGKFDLNQQMAAFILWQTVYQQSFYEYYYTSWGMYQDTNKILSTYFSANDYAVITATSYVNSYLKTGVTSMQDYLAKMVASADAALAAGLKLEAHDKKEAKAYVDQLQTYYTQFKNEFASVYTEYQSKGTAIPNDNVWNLRSNLALSSFQDFLDLSVGETFKASDIEDAAKLMIMYSKYTDYMSMELEDDATDDMLQDFILKHPAGHFETKYFALTGAEEALIRNFFTDKFMAERYKSTVAKYVASLDLNKNMTSDEKTAQLKALGMDTFTTYTKTLDADGKATYSNNLNAKIGDVVFNTSIKKDQISVIADGEKVYLVYFNADSTATTATLSFKEYTYEACKDKLPEIENIEAVIAECIKTAENTTDFLTDNEKAADLLGQLNDKTATMPEGATVANTKKGDTDTAPKSILDVLYGKDAKVTEGWNFTVNDPTVSYVVTVTAIEKDAEGKNTTNYTISYVEFKDDAFAALLRTFEEEFTLYMVDTKTNAPVYNDIFKNVDDLEEKFIDWLLDENFVELVLSKKANNELDALLAAKKDTDKTKLKDELVKLFGENGVQDFTKSYSTQKEFETKYDSKVYDYIFNTKNKDTATVIVGKDDRVFLVYVAPMATGEAGHEGHDHTKTVHAAIKEYNFEDYESELMVGTGENAKSYREQIKADLIAKDRKDTTEFKSADDLAKEELDKYNKNEKTWPTKEELLPAVIKKPTSSATSTSIVPQAIINKIYPNGSSTTKVDEKTLAGIFQVDSNGTSYLVKVTQFPAADDKELSCKVQYLTFEDSEYYSYFRAIQTKLNSSLKETETDLKYPESITDGSYQDWLFKGEYVEAKDGKDAAHVFERKENDLTFIAATDSKGAVTGLTIYMVSKAPEQVKDETEVVYGGYLSFATKKDAEKALKQLKGKDGFALLDKFVSTKSITTDEHGEESATTPTLDFALKKDAVTEENVKNWLFGDRKAYDVDIVESKDGKSFYLVIYVSKEGASMRTARTAWIDEALTAHVDALVKDGGYTFNEEALAKVEDVVTTTTK